MQANWRHSKERTTWDLGDLPFVFQYGESPTNGKYDLSDRLPFCLEMDSKTGLLKQAVSPRVLSSLERAYKLGSNLSGTMDPSGIGAKYAQDFLNFIESVISDIATCHIVEIGCGTGYMLSLLQEKGAEVLGVEPGPQGQEAAGNFGVKVIRDFFPSKFIADKYDVVIAYAVLEHLSHPNNFLQHVKKILAPKGKVILAVPDCEPYLKAGDLSCLFHEHWSYFTSQTLDRVMQQEGFTANITKAEFGGCLYCGACTQEINNESHEIDNARLLQNYRAKSMQNTVKLTNLLTSAEAGCQSVGVYVPARLLNSLALIHDQIDITRLRFFDDNQAIYEKYLPGFNSPLENWEDFLKEPTDIVLIASHTFDHKIRDRIESTTNSIVVDWADLYLNQ